jgi:hypothetical protein
VHLKKNSCFNVKPVLPDSSAGQFSPVLVPDVCHQQYKEYCADQQTNCFKKKKNFLYVSLHLTGKTNTN